ncbi:tRNA adenosine(34) deaminase TadA [Dasania sp. GY-MA-18]|uniref:tRNA-specific adenosine deaminase n=1 Tax=Dasania phycosphaerae TaxID=2950436 RepID=A0A9J6RRR2_9GAMM|nr:MULTISPECIES: tRNA adenosine(34) deaminase TadA [Dasania]MCR8924203.1 tRNA adenosine(34) deaminase TadA [Dasania sp. GY-MA-18]MCZ0866856.1 tRNA adenosine(34) deaminase TadA [Dasania phycosphaerae]MCZ0870361.1 tRNA adenosine(34) deaminase TadA [Dasania phycosphaerae]
MLTDEYWMAKALLLAEQGAAKGEVPVGAILVADDKVLGQGYNCPISSNDPTAHAEVMAVRDAATVLGNYRLPETTLYVTLEPCTMCAGALVHARVTRVVYGATEPKAGVVESNPCVFEGEHLNHKVAYQGGVLAAECSAMLSTFFKKRREEKKGVARG